MNNLILLAREIRDFIGKNQIPQALRILIDASDKHDELNEVLLHSARYEEIRTKIRSGIVADEYAGQELNRIREAVLSIAWDLDRIGRSNIQVFISYSRKGPGNALVKLLHDQLEENGFVAFLDTEDIQPGEDWGKSIIGSLKASDYLVLFLCPNANESEMVLKEVEIARELADKQGKPRILPVRLQWDAGRPLNYRLRGWLSKIQHLKWESDTDSDHVVGKLLDVVSERGSLRILTEVTEKEIEVFDQYFDGPPTPMAPLEVPQGSVRLQSPYYLERAGEAEFISRLEDPGALLRIKGPRQFGKTSLLVRLMERARQLEYHVVPIDFQDFSESTLSNLKLMIRTFCEYIADETNLDHELEEFWTDERDSKQLALRFIGKIVLPRIEHPILLALDEADRLFSYPDVSSDFFLMLRAWHERSKSRPAWEKLKMAISYSTEAKMAIQNLNASPFNVGEEARITPFDEVQVARLVDLHRLPMGKEQIMKLIELVGGQPYLVRRALYLISKGEYSYEQLLDIASESDGPYSDHLRHHLVNVKQHEDLEKEFKSIVRQNRSINPINVARLEAAGLTKGTHPEVVPANNLYRKFFQTNL